MTDDRGRPARAPGLVAWLRRVAPRRAHGVVTIALVSDARIRALNRTYRGKDRATDVLSFPTAARRRGANNHPRSPSPTPSPTSSPQPPAPSHLGDIAISLGAARRQAQAAGHAQTAELRVLALHGLLHLLGYDHERDNGAMYRLEQRLRRKGGLREGLIERMRS